MYAAKKVWQDPTFFTILNFPFDKMCQMFLAFYFNQVSKILFSYNLKKTSKYYSQTGILSYYGWYQHYHRTYQSFHLTRCLSVLGGVFNAWSWKFFYVDRRRTKVTAWLSGKSAIRQNFTTMVRLTRPTVKWQAKSYSDYSDKKLS